MSGPLDGVVVLDLCHFLAGPYATFALADLGADVIKLEDPDRPDEARAIGPYFQDDASLYFLALNAGKRSLAVRLATEEGCAVVHELVDKVDVVVDNYRPGVMRKLGLDHARLAERNPRIVTCSLTGFGETGAYTARAGYDYTIQALSGVMSVTGDPDRPPGKAGISYVDHSGGLAAALAVVSALLERDRTGAGRHLDVGLMDVQVSMLSYLAAWTLNAGAEPGRHPDASHPSIVPAQNFATADGYLSLFVGNDPMWRRLVIALEEPRLADERFVTLAGRAAAREEVIGILAEVLAAQGAAHWSELLARHSVPCAPVNRIGQALEDEHVVSRGLVAEAAHARYGGYRHVRGPLPRVSERELPGAPDLGEHSADVLREAGFDDARVAELVAAGVVATAE